MNWLNFFSLHPSFNYDSGWTYSDWSNKLLKNNFTACAKCGLIKREMNRDHACRPSNGSSTKRSSELKRISSWNDSPDWEIDQGKELLYY